MLSNSEIKLELPSKTVARICISFLLSFFSFNSFFLPYFLFFFIVCIHFFIGFSFLSFSFIKFFFFLLYFFLCSEIFSSLTNSTTPKNRGADNSLMSAYKNNNRKIS